MAKTIRYTEKINVSKTGLKMVNQDSELEMLLKKYFGTTDIDNMLMSYLRPNWCG